MLQAAEAVCGFEPIEDWEVLDVLTSLVDKSLVLAEEENGATRYRMLQTLKQYGAEKRDASGADGETERVKNKHRDYFMALAEEAEPYLTGPEQRAWLNRLESEHDNLRAVLDECATPSGDGEAGLRLAGALSIFWTVRGYPSEGREQTERTLGLSQMEVPIQTQPAHRAAKAKALSGAGNLAHQQGDNKELERARLLLSPPFAPDGAFSAAWEQGRAMTWEQAVDYTLH